LRAAGFAVACSTAASTDTTVIKPLAKGKAGISSSSP
jgi:hypothetical protein